MKNGGASLDRYNYVRTDANSPNKVIDVHDVFVKRSNLRLFFTYIGRLFLLANILLLLTEKDKLSAGSFWRLFLGVTSAKLLQFKPIKKESVVIMPSYGVQLETHHWSGKIDRKFIPVGTILKPVLNECITPVTCYWSLALLLQDEDQLLLVFQKLKPPIEILVPVWRALCKAINLENLSHSLNSSTKSHLVITT